MTITFASTAADGGGGTASNSNINDNGNNNNSHNNNENTAITAFDGRRVLAAKTDSLSNVVNNVATGRYHRRAVNGSRVNKEAVMGVRRVLFGPPDHPALTRAWLERQLYAVASKNARSYNFDFVNERPMLERPNNRYAWERVRKPVVVAPPPPPQTQVVEEPAAAATSAAAVATPPAEVTAAVIPDAAAATPATEATAAATPATEAAASATQAAAAASPAAAPATTAAVVVVQEVQVPTDCSRTTKLQSKLTAFMKNKKRTLSDKAAAEVEELASSQSAPKRSRRSVASVV